MTRAAIIAAIENLSSFDLARVLGSRAFWRALGLADVLLLDDATLDDICDEFEIRDRDACHVQAPARVSIEVRRGDRAARRHASGDGSAAMIARCCDCGEHFYREPDEVWKVRCLDCWFARRDARSTQRDPHNNGRRRLIRCATSSPRTCAGCFPCATPITTADRRCRRALRNGCSTCANAFPLDSQPDRRRRVCGDTTCNEGLCHESKQTLRTGINQARNI